MIFNNSSLMDAELCWRKYNLSHVQRLGLKYDQSSPSFSARFEGILWHAIMAEHYSKGEHFEMGVEALINDGFKQPLADATFAEEHMAIAARKKWFFAMYEAYAAYYKSDLDRWEILGVEEQLIVPMDEFCHSCNTSLAHMFPAEAPKHALCACGAKLDFLVAQIDLRYREDGVLWICDHKTKKTSVGEAYMAAFQESTQFTHYMFVAKRAFDEDYHTGTANVVAKLKLITAKGHPFHRNTEIIRGPLDFLQWHTERTELRNSVHSRLYNGTTPPLIRSWPRNAVSCRRYGLCHLYGLCWPARDVWWKPPEDLEDSFEVQEEMHLDNYKALLQGETG